MDNAKKFLKAALVSLLEELQAEINREAENVSFEHVDELAKAIAGTVVLIRDVENMHTNH